MNTTFLKTAFKKWFTARRVVAVALALLIVVSMALTSFASSGGEAPAAPGPQSLFALDYSLSALDPGTTTITATLTASGAENGVADIVDDATGLSVLPSPGATVATVAITGNGSYTYTATDGAGNTAKCSFAITNIPPAAPVISLSGDVQNGYYKGAATFTLSHQDAQTASLYYVLDGQGRQPYTTPVAVDTNGTHTLVAVAVDENSQESTSTQSFTIKTSWPQLVLGNGPFGMRQGDTLEVSFALENMPGATVTAASSDPAQLPGSAFSVAQQPDGGCSLTITAPAAAAPGSYTITLTAQDADESITAAFPLGVAEASAPVSTLPAALHVRHDGSLAYDLSAAFADPDGRPLTYQLLTPPANGTAEVNGPALTYTPDGAAATESLTLRVSNGVKHTDATVAVHVYAPPTVPDAPVAFSLAEDSAAQALDLSLHCSDPRGQALRYEITAQPEHGTASISGATLLYTPAANYFGADSLTITVGHTGSDFYTQTVTVALTVTPEDDPPIAVDDGPFGVDSNGSILIDVLANDIAVDGGALDILAIETGPAKGSCAIEDGQIRYTPNPRKSGADSFTYSVVHQGKTLSHTATVTLTINQVNDQHRIELADDSLTIPEDGQLTFLFDVIDIDGGGSAGYNVTLSSTNALVFAEDAAYTVTSQQISDDICRYTVVCAPLPYANTTEHGGAGILITVTDKNTPSLVATATQNVVVTPVNNPPAIAGHPTAPVEINEDGSYTLTFTVTDPDIQAPLTGFGVLVTSADQAVLPDSRCVQTGAVLLDARTVQYTYTLTPLPDANSPGGLVVTINAKDDGPGADQQEDTVSFLLVVHAVNDAPVLSGLPAAYSMEEDDPQPITFRAKDVDTPLGTSHFSVTHTDTTGTYIAGAVIQSVAPVGGSSTEYDVTLLLSFVQDACHPAPTDRISFTVTADDGAGGTAAKTFTLNITPVNDAPVIGFTYPPSPGYPGVAAPQYFYSQEDHAFDIPIGVADVESAGETLFLTVAVAADARGVVSSVYVQPVDNAQPNERLVHFAPAKDQNGLVELKLTLYDGQTASTRNLFVYINPENDAPVAKPDTFTFTEAKQGASPVYISIAGMMANDTDVDQATNGDVISFDPSLLSGPSEGSLAPHYEDSQLVGYYFTPVVNSENDVTFTYGIRDTGGAYATTTVTLKCTPVNDRPVIEQLADQSVLEGGSITVSLVYSDLETATGDLLITIGSKQPDIINADGLTFNKATGELTITPLPYMNGEVTIAVTVSDKQLMTTMEFTVNVISVDDAPVAVNDAYSAVAGRMVVLNPLDNDYDMDKGDTFTIQSITPLSVPNGSVVTLNADRRTLSFQAPAGYTGSCTIEYTIEDSTTPTPLTSTATITVNVSAFGAGPMLEALPAVITSAGSSVPLTLALHNVPGPKTYTLLATADDTGLLPNTALSIAGGTHQETGLTGDSQTFQINVPTGVSGNTSVTVVLTYDGKSDTIVIPVTISRENAPPVAVNDSYTLDEGESETLDVLENDTDDQVPKSLTILSVTRPSGFYGYVEVVDNKIRYTPPTSHSVHYYNGTQSFTYTVMDPGGKTSTGTVTLTVLPKPSRPHAYGEYRKVTGHPDNTTSIEITTLLDNDGDMDDWNVAGTSEMDTARLLLVSCVFISADNTSTTLDLTDVSAGTGSNGKKLTFTPTRGEGWYAFVYKVQTTNVRSDQSSMESNQVTAYVGVSFGGRIAPRLSGNTYYANEDDNLDAAKTIDITGLINAFDTSTSPVSLVYCNATANGGKQVDDILAGYGITIENGTATLSYMQKPDANGTITFTWKVSQGVQGTDYVESNEGTITLHIYAVNDAPVITLPSPLPTQTLRGDVESLSIQIADVDNTHEQLRFCLNSSDDKIIPSDSMALEYVSGDTYKLTFTSIDTYADTTKNNITLTIDVSDGLEADSESFVIQVLPRNRAPQTEAQPRQSTIEEDTQGEYDVVAWGNDPDGDAMSIICDNTADNETGIFFGGTGSHTTQYGTVAGSVKKLIFSPAKDYYTQPGEFIEIRYKLSDGELKSGIGIIRIAISPLNDAPEIYDLLGSYSMVEDLPQTLTFHVRDVDTVLEKDNLSVATDDTGLDYVQTAEITSLVPTANDNEYLATLQFTFKPDAFHATAAEYVTITVDADDKMGGTARKTFTLNITGVNDAVRPRPGNSMPYFLTVNDPIIETNKAILEDNPLIIDLVSLFEDPEGQEITIFELTDEQFGEAKNEGGKVHFMPQKDFFNQEADRDDENKTTKLARFRFTVTDPHNGSYSNYVYIFINPVNDAPVTPNFSAATNEDVPIDLKPIVWSGNRIVYDVDDDITTLEISGVSVQNGLGTAAVIRENGQPDRIRFIPYADLYGTEVISYTVKDPGGAQSTGKITLTIHSVVDDPRLAFDTGLPGWDQTAVEPGTIVVWSMDEDGDTSFDFRMWQPEANANLALTLMVYDWKEADPTNGLATHTSVVPRNRIQLLAGADAEHRKVQLQPLANKYGDLLLEFTLQAGSQSITRYVHVVVNSVNDLPVVSGASHSTPENTAITKTITATDVETPAASLVFTLHTPAQHGTAALSRSGGTVSWTYTPGPSYYGADSFQVAVTDGDGGQSLATISITVTPVNDAPSTPDSVATDKTLYRDGETVTLTFTPSVDDLYETPADQLVYTIDASYDGGASWSTLTDTQTYSLAQIEAGTLSYAFAPQPGQNTAGFQLRVKATDTGLLGAPPKSSGYGTTGTMKLDNTAPVLAAAISPSANTSDDVTITLTVTDSGAGASGPASQPPTGAGASFVDSPGPGVYRYTVPKNGTYSFTAMDMAGNTSAQKDVVVSNIDKLRPVVTASTANIPAAAGKYADSGVEITLTYADALATAEYIHSGIAAQQYLLSTSDAQPDSDDTSWQNYTQPIALDKKGSWYLHARATDNVGNEAVFSFGPYVILNSAPLAQDAIRYVNEHEDNGDGSHKTTIDLKALVTDADGDSLSFTIASAPQARYGSWTHLGNGVYEFAHSGYGMPFAPTLAVTYYAQDSGGATSATKTITISVAEVNDQPTQPGGIGPATGSFKDGDTFTLRWTASSDEETGTGDITYEIQISYDGGTSWQPVATTAPGATSAQITVASAGKSGTLRLRLRANDNYTTLPAKTSDWADSPVYTLDNAPPTATAGFTSGGAAYTPGTNAIEAIDIRFGFADTGGSGLKKYGYALTQDPTAPTEESGYRMLGTPLNHTERCRAIGVYYLHLYAVDQAGNRYAQTFNLVIVNTNPTAYPQTVYVDEGGSVTITLEGSDNDYGDYIAGYALEGSSPYVAHGALAPALDGGTPIPGKYVYTHDGSEPTGNDSFTFSVSDSSGAKSGNATVTIVIRPVNDAPEIQNLLPDYTWLEDTEQTILFQLFDPDNTAEEIGLRLDLSASDVITRDGLHLTRLPNGQAALRIRPAPDAYTQPGAPVLLTLTATDPAGLTDQRTVELHVQAVNDAPRARDQYYTILGGCSIADQVRATDVEGDSLTYTLVTGPLQGSFTPDADFLTNGSFTYKPNPGTVNDSVDISISDGQASTQITLHFTGSIEEEEDCTTIVRQLVFETDIPANATCRLSSSHPSFFSSNHKVEILGNVVRISIDVNPDAFGSAQLELELLDSGGAQLVQATIPVEVAARNDAPRQPALSLQVPYGRHSATGRLSPDDSADGAFAVTSFTYALSPNLLDAPANGTVVLNADGTFTYTPRAGFYGTDLFYLLVAENGNDAANNPAPASLPAGVSLVEATTTDDLQVRVPVQVTVLPKPKPNPQPDPAPENNPGGGDGPGTPANPGPAPNTRPEDGPRPDGSSSAPDADTRPPSGENGSSDAPAGSSSAPPGEDLMIVADTDDGDGLTAPGTPGPGVLPAAAGCALGLLLVLLLLFFPRIRIRYTLTRRDGTPATYTRTLYGRRLHHRGGMRLDVSSNRVEDIGEATLELRMGRLYRRNFYRRPLHLSFGGAQAVVRVPAKDAYKQSRIVVNGSDFS